VTAPPPSPSQPRIKIDRQPKQITFCKEPLSEEVALELVQIPAGEFFMGSPENELDRPDAESPQHLVTVPGFWMGQYPVTQAEWRVVAGLPKVSRDLKPDPSRFKGNRHPVEQVSWYDAVEFCDRLTQHTGRTYRLPSEAEWEYACRAGTTTPFHFGETIATEVANYHGEYIYGRGNKGEYRQATTPVDHFGVANAFGLSDMHGNVYEWCLDHWHGNYEGAPTDGRAWLDDNDNDNDPRIIRGGSWFDNPRYCRSAYRFHDTPDDTINGLGFRVVVAPRGLR
jgi:formylglycine-generating enzyme required for sulfatase activity